MVDQAFSLRFTREFASDLERTVDWYERQSTDAAKRFRIQLERIFSSLTTCPESFGKWEDPHRVARITGFPYLVLFEIVEGQFVILKRLKHAATDPQSWHT